MSSDLSEKQRRELERLRIAKALDRRERENSSLTTGRLTAIGAVASAVIGLGGFLYSLNKHDAPAASIPTIINGDVINSRDDNSNNRGSIGTTAGGDVVNDSKTVTQTVVLPQPAPAKIKDPRPIAAVSDYKKYIDSDVQRLAGTTNVAIALRGLPGFPPGALESVVQRALRERGFRIVPIFRNQFRVDEAELRLFNGDASFAGRLKLREHCDSVLLGVLRFGGPAQEVDGGLYVREAVLEIRALDPSTGLVIDSLEISEKGGGATAELSSINAVSRLKESVSANISGWSWV